MNQPHRVGLIDVFYIKTNARELIIFGKQFNLINWVIIIKINIPIINTPSYYLSNNFLVHKLLKYGLFNKLLIKRTSNTFNNKK